ncbi:ABC transporter permease [Roseitranquillus sediminis]|uniref:ABC transporter permease n=1 Tax=Roseitranquillus sediminis TaxID=2809051 RepID=UPI001D0C6712|nr:ABC transporter permease [Roseitranquillus sediminis]MBM9595664.1 ABC transporter permease [Roseitranquillus sediminis]
MKAAGLTAILSHWRRHPVQLATLILGLSLATALWSGVQAINAEARASYDAAARAIGGDGLPSLHQARGAAIPLDTYVALRRAGWLVTPVVEGTLRMTGGEVRLLGVDLLTAPPPALEGDLAGDVEPIDALGESGRLFAAPEIAARLASPDLPPVVAVEGVAPGLALADIGVAQRVLGEARIDRLLVLPDQPLGRPPLSEIAPDLEERAPDRQGGVARLTDSFHLNLTAFGLLSFVVGLFIVNGAVGLAFEQRRPTFRTLRALGLTARSLVTLLAVELLILSLAAGAIGMGLGGLIAAALLPDVAATLRGLYGATIEGSLTLRPAWWAAGIAIAVLGTAVAASGALWKVARLPALAPAQPRAWALASARTRRLQGAAAALLALAAVVLAVAGSGLVAGFLMLGALLLAAALLLPLWLAACLAGGQRLARGALAEWFWADTRQQLPGLSLALMSLLLALAANIGVGTMVDSFRLTFTGWLDQRLASELYVTARDDDEAARLVPWLEARADAVLPIARTDQRVAGAPAEIYGVADHPTYRDNWPLLAAEPEVWDAVAAGNAVLVNEQLARREGLRPGDPLDLPDGWRTRVGGIYSDYGNPAAQVLIGLDELYDRFPDYRRGDYGVRIAPERAEALRTALVDDFSLSPDQIVDQAALKRLSLDIFERTFAVTAALNVLTLTVAGFAILTSLLTLATLRLPQLAPVWALGLTRRHLAALELTRALVLAALTFSAAVPVGLMLAWVLLSVINVEAFGWSLPMHVFPADWARLALLSLLAAGVAGLWPARRLATRPPADLVKVFAHER